MMEASLCQAVYKHTITNKSEVLKTLTFQKSKYSLQLCKSACERAGCIKQTRDPERSSNLFAGG